tara:strand:+ start:118 stop:420 length:303 start_codon:yes stop_codon:yes gene_type:complete
MGIEIVKINSMRDYAKLLRSGHILTLRNDERDTPYAHVKHKGKKTGIVVRMETIGKVQPRDTSKYVKDSSFDSNTEWWHETWKFNGHSNTKLLTRIERVN